MRISILDTQHFEVALNALRFFDAPENRLHLHTTLDIYSRFAEALGAAIGDFDWSVLPAPGCEKSFLRTLADSACRDGVSLLWIATITNNHLACSRAARAVKRSGGKVVVVLHNLRTWFGWRVPTRASQAMELLGIKLLLRATDGICVLSSSLSAGLPPSLRNRLPLFVVPGLPYPEAIARPLRAEPGLTIAIPGRIEERRRDYCLALEALESLLTSRRDLRLILLGPPVGLYGQKILERSEALRAAGADIVTFASFVPQQVFHSFMMSSHIILAPVQRGTINRGVLEYYGSTKSSGALDDAARYALPALIPGHLPLPPPLEPTTIRFESAADLSRSVSELLESPSGFHALERRARDRAKACDIEQVRRENAVAFAQLGVNPFAGQTQAGAERFAQGS